MKELVIEVDNVPSPLLEYLKTATGMLSSRFTGLFNISLIFNRDNVLEISFYVGRTQKLIIMSLDKQIKHSSTLHEILKYNDDVFNNTWRISEWITNSKVKGSNLIRSSGGLLWCFGFGYNKEILYYSGSDSFKIWAWLTCKEKQAIINGIELDKESIIGLNALREFLK